MITRLIGRIQRFYPFRSAYCFAKSDDSNNKGGFRKPFFSKNKPKDKASGTDIPNEAEEPKNPFKLSREQRNELNSNRNKKDMHHQKQLAPKGFKLKLKDIEQAEQSPFVSATENEKSYSIFHEKLEGTPEAEVNLKASPTLNQQDYEKSENADTVEFSFDEKLQFYNKLAADSQKLLILFDGQKWNQLNLLVKSYASLTVQGDVQRQLHPLFVRRSGSKYVAWLEASNISVHSLPENVVRILMAQLIYENQFKIVKQLSNSMKKNHIDVGYKNLDALFENFSEKAPISQLRKEIPSKIQAALALLNAIDTKCKVDKDGNHSIGEDYQLNDWMINLWAASKDRHVGLQNFIKLFQALVIKHHKRVNLLHIHSNGIFLDVIETYYFGSHLTTSKIKELFEHAFNLPDFDILLSKLRNSMRLYWLRTGNVPFPNVHNLQQQIKSALKIEDYERVVFFYLLSQYTFRETPFKIFEKDKKLLTLLRANSRFDDIINDGLFNLPKQQFLQPNPKFKARLIDQRRKYQEEAKKFQSELNRFKKQKDQKDLEFNEEINDESQGFSSEDDFLAKMAIKQTPAEKELQSFLQENMEGSSVRKVKKNRRLSPEQVQKQFEKNLTRSEKRKVNDQTQQYRPVQSEQQEELNRLIEKYDLKDTPEVRAFLSLHKERFFDIEPKEQKQSYLHKGSQENDEEHDSIDSKFEAELTKEGIFDAVQQPDQKILASLIWEKEPKYDSDDMTVDQSEFQEHIWSKRPPANSFVSNLEFLHRVALRKQASEEQNFYRKQLLKTLITTKVPLEAVKAAIKLDKPQLAFTLFKQVLMIGPIQDRTERDVEYVIKCFLQDHYKVNKDFNIHQIINSITLETVRDAQYINQKSVNFFGSIYEKRENFDSLIWQNLPQGEMKYNFWESSLILDRAQQLIKMEVSGKFKNMAYERQYEELPKRSVKQFSKNTLNWRDQLIHGLGIQEPQPVPEDETNDMWVKFDSIEEVNQYVVQNLIDQNTPLPNQSIRYYGKEFNSQFQEFVEKKGIENLFNENYIAFEQLANKLGVPQAVSYLPEEHQEGEEAAEEQQEVQGQVEQAAEGQAAVQGQQIPEGEQIQAQASQKIEQKEQIHEKAQGEVNSQELSAAENGEKVELSQLSEKKGDQIEQAGADASISQKSSTMEKDQNIFEYSKRMNIQGYDFATFLHHSMTVYKPMFEKGYQNQKEFKKHMLAMEAITEQAMFGANQNMKKKLNESEQGITNPLTIAKLAQHGLWNYDFCTVSNPLEYLEIADRFRVNFFEFKKYMGLKEPGAVPNLSKVRIYNFTDLTINRRVTPRLVEELLAKRHDLFLQAEAVVKLEPMDQVEEIMLWGVLSDEPLAIYLGQKLAMLTNQKISHKLALVVAEYLSHRREVPAERIRKCKQALKIVGRINREHIYQLSRDYEHISIRKRLNKYIVDRKMQLEEDSLSYLTRLDPTHSVKDSAAYAKTLNRAGIAV